MFEKIITKIFPKLLTEMKTQMQEAQKTPSRINTKIKTTYKYITSKLKKTKINEKILKATRLGHTLLTEEQR